MELPAETSAAAPPGTPLRLLAPSTGQDPERRDGDALGEPEPGPPMVAGASGESRARAYNPAQRAVIDLLGRDASSGAVFDEDIGRQLEDELEAALLPLAAEITPDRPLWIGKHQLSTVHGCETQHVAEAARPFEWSIPVARGSVAHRAIELGVNWQGEPSPQMLVDEALARLIEEQTQGLGAFLGGLTSAHRADLRSQAVARVAAFEECFPPLKREWRPVTESRVRVELCGSRIVLAGKTDLTLGRARGMTAGKVIIDLKSGRVAAGHRDDLRFYALLETIKLGVPPRKLASYYLETGRAHPEEVSAPLLQAAVRRTADGVGKIVALAGGARSPTTTPGPPCAWCPVLATCEVGQAERARSDDGWEP
jgi:hypothetical protein